MAPSAISPDRDGQLDLLASLTSKFDDTIRFYLNGTKVVLDDIDPEITVLEYLRGIGLTGTKLYEKSLVPNKTLGIIYGHPANILVQQRLW